MKQIWVKNERETKNTCFTFCLKVENITKGDVLKIAALNIYSVYIDGEFTRFGPEKTAHGLCAVEEIELDTFGKSELSVAVVVTGYNIPVLSVQTAFPYFSAEIVSGDGRVKYTADDFSAHRMTDRERVINKYSYQRHFCESYVMKKDRADFFKGEYSLFPEVETEEVTGCKEVAKETHLPAYNKISSTLVKTRKAYVDENKKEYVDRYLQGLPESGGFLYDSLERNTVAEANKLCAADEPASEGDMTYSLYDFGIEKSGFFKMKLDVEETTVAYLVWDEILVDGKLDFLRMETSNVIKYTLEPGQYDITSIEPYSARYAAVIKVSGKAKIAPPEMVLFENPDVGRLKISCADEDYVKIMDAARNTLAQNCVDIPTDCPSRERAGWLCDSYFIDRAEKIFTGANVVCTHHLVNYAGSPQIEIFPKGALAMCYPGDFPGERYIPNWMMWYVLEIADGIKRIGGRKNAELSKEKVKGVLDYFKNYENEYGLLEKLDSWVFVEWSAANTFVQEINFPSNMLYVGMLRAAAEILGDDSLNLKADKLTETIREMARPGLFFVDNANRDKDGKIVLTENTTETCQYYAFYFGVATPERDRELFETLLRDFGATRDTSKVFPKVHKSNAIVGNYLRLFYLSENGYPERALAECKDYFIYMAERTGTLWEHDNTSASCNHGFASSVAPIVLRGLIGYDGVDECEKKVSFIDVSLKNDCEVEIPVITGDFIKVFVKDGKRSVTLPEGYSLK